MSLSRTTCLLGAALCAACSAPGEPPPAWGPWSDPKPVAEVNTAAAVEGCPIESPDGRSLYIASNRAVPGAQGKLDIYRSRRTASGGWSEPENLGAPINSPEFDYCPTPVANGALYFISSRAVPEDCYPGDAPPPAPPGGPAPGDMYRSVEEAGRGWTKPVHLGCYPQGPNTAGAEYSPSLVRTAEGTFLYFSSDGYPDSQGQDIYVSRVADDGSVGPGKRVAELSTSADDRMPNVSADGLEIVFSSNRAGSTPFDQDIYVATRPSTSAAWSAPPTARPARHQHAGVGDARVAVGRWLAALLRSQARHRRPGRRARQHPGPPAPLTGPSLRAHRSSAGRYTRSTTSPANTAAPNQLLCRKAWKHPARDRVRISR